MDRDNLDLIFVNRLIESPPEQYPQQPLHYLLACFGRSSSELRGMSPRHDAATQQQLQGSITACRELIVQYAALILTDAGVIPQVGQQQKKLVLEWQRLLHILSAPCTRVVALYSASNARRNSAGWSLCVQG